METATLQGGTLQSLPENHIEPFLNHLRAAGYCKHTKGWMWAIGGRG